MPSGKKPLARNAQNRAQDCISREPVECRRLSNSSQAAAVVPTSPLLGLLSEGLLGPLRNSAGKLQELARLKMGHQSLPAPVVDLLKSRNGHGLIARVSGQLAHKRLAPQYVPQPFVALWVSNLAMDGFP